ncbi:MAG TPA: glycosyltransferase family 1 protein [Candidatus Omnitrophota bacterium]|nr:glycosyltransferase family 1 protein [Candidatus Omnitrophota bacterium]HPS36808.1 glycosyltransferase family 1 protein [Candidatus Omnitrophota bacterium]
MQIAIDGRLLHRTVSGTERYMRELIGGMTLYDRGRSWIFVTADARYEAKNEFKNIRLLSRITVEDKIDVYHRTFQAQNYDDILELLVPKRSIITIPDLIHCKLPNLFDGERARKRYCHLMKYALQVTDRIIAMSQHGKRDIVESFSVDEGKVKVISLGVDSRKFKKIDSREVARFKQRFDLPEKYILFIGADYPHKNLSNLLEAFRFEALAGHTLVLTGSNHYPRGQKRVREDLRKSGIRVKDLGYVEDAFLPYLYGGADLFVFPSLQEGFGLPVLEAFACEVPVVCSKATSLPEVAGEAALMVDATKPGEIAQAIGAVLGNSDVRRKLVDRGKERVKLFQWEDCIRKTYALYQETLEKPGSMKSKRSRAWKALLLREKGKDAREEILRTVRSFFRNRLGI